MRSPSLSELPPPPHGQTGWPWTEAAPAAPDRMPNGISWPRISIVTPSYNQGQFIEETIRSVLLQGYPDLEYIIVDGGSSDATVDILKKYKDWLTYWVSEPDDGQADAINKGLDKASGVVFGFLNSDDSYQESILTTVAESYCRSAIKERYCGAFSVINFNEQDEAIIRPDHDLAFERWITHSVSLHQPGVFWATNLLNSVGGFDKKYRYAFDRKFFIQLVMMGVKFAFHDDVIAARFRIHSASKTFQEEMNGCGFKREFAELSSEILCAAPLEYRYRYRSYQRQNYMSHALSGEKGVPDFRKGLLSYFNVLVRYPDAVASRFFWGMLLRYIWRLIREY